MDDPVEKLATVLTSLEELRGRSRLWSGAQVAERLTALGAAYAEMQLELGRQAGELQVLRDRVAALVAEHPPEGQGQGAALPLGVASDVVGVSDASLPGDPAVRGVNRDRRPFRRRSGRVNLAAVPVEQQVGPGVLRAAEMLRTASLTPGDLGSGRGFTYEWENYVQQVFQDVADAGLGPQTFEFDQPAAAAVWTVNHGLSSFPTVLIVDPSGQELLAEVHYPDDQTVVIVHGQPYSGTAYLRI